MTATDLRESGRLSGKRIAILAADGVEQVELERPRAAVVDAGAEVDLVSIATDPIQAMNQDVEPGEQFTPDKTVADADPAAYAALILPGGR